MEVSVSTSSVMSAPRTTEGRGQHQMMPPSRGSLPGSPRVTGSGARLTGRSGSHRSLHSGGMGDQSVPCHTSGSMSARLLREQGAWVQQHISPLQSANATLAAAASLGRASRGNPQAALSHSNTVLSLGSATTRSPRTMAMCLSARTLHSRGSSIETDRLMTPREADILRMKGEKERRLQMGRDSRKQLAEATQIEAMLRTDMLDKQEALRKEVLHRKAEEEQRQRILIIEEKQIQAELRSSARGREQVQQTAIESSSRSRLTSPRGLSVERRELNRQERARLEEEELRRKADKQYEINKAKEARRLERGVRAQQKSQVNLDFHDNLRSIDAVREQLREQDELKRQRARERREIQAEARTSQRQAALEAKKAKEAREHQAKERSHLKRGQEAEAMRLLELQMAGERERLQKEARALKQKELELQHRQRQLVQASVEEKTKRLFEAKDRKEKERHLRRFLDIEKRQVQAEVQKLEREKIHNKEQDTPADYFVPPAPKARLIPGAINPVLLGVTGHEQPC